MNHFLSRLTVSLSVLYVDKMMLFVDRDKED